MTDASVTPDQIDAPDPVEAPPADQVEAPDPVEAPLAEQIEHAKKTFSLKERLSGFKAQRKRIPLFLDESKVAAYEVAKLEADVIFGQAERVGIKDDVRDALLDKHDEALTKVSALREEMLASALSVHVATYPNVVLEGVRREQRKWAKETFGKQLSDEQTELLEERIGHAALAKGIERIVDSAGDEAESTEVEDVIALKEMLPPLQWAHLLGTWEALMFNDRAVRAAVEEPGF